MIPDEGDLWHQVLDLGAALAAIFIPIGLAWLGTKWQSRAVRPRNMD